MKHKIILAIHAGHNASALIGDEQGIAYAVQEERLKGEKNYWGFPEKSIKACLKSLGITASQVDKVVFGARLVLPRYHSREDVIHSYQRQDQLGGKIRQRFLMPMALKLIPNYGQKEVIRSLIDLGFDESNIGFFDHHTSHAASAYYGLRKDDSDYLVMTCDGSGDDICASVRVMGPEQKDEIIATTQWNNSLGALYSWTTFRMGFVPLEHEYKLMGMAPYCAPHYSNQIKEVFKDFLWLDKSGLSFKRRKLKRISDSSKDIFSRLDGTRFDSICGGLQSFTEELLATWVKNAVQKTGVRRVLAAGGVFMNVKANQIIASLPEVEYFEAFPSCGDETLPFGAYYQQVVEDFGDDQIKPLPHFYFGDTIDDQEALNAIGESGLDFVRPLNIAEKIAEILAHGYPLARCSGAMEFGARALGNRSILADPGNPDVVRVINQMVKKRDFWMPFAPMMIRETSKNYIDNPKNIDSPYMMMTFKTRDNFKDMIAAVHNADLTCRAQLLEEFQNPEMHQIIKEFQALTNRSVVLNTSFNLHGYPIARTPEDALFILQNSGLEFLQLGDYIVYKDKSKYESCSLQKSSMSH